MRRTAEPRHRLAIAMLIVVGLVEPARALVQEYQVVRLITYRTSCDPTNLEDVSPKADGKSGAKPGAMRFHATCGDLTSYPDGLDVLCEDRDDDRSCKVVTAERTFDKLELLAPRH